MLTTPQHMQVASDHDMILLRQAVRQAARAAGLGTAQQARFTAAVSEVARALFLVSQQGRFTIRLSEPPGRGALEVVCASECADRSGAGALFASSSVAGARDLVDDACLEPAEPCPRLLLRMWLGR